MSRLPRLGLALVLVSLLLVGRTVHAEGGDKLRKVSDATFHATVLESPLPVLVMFHATWGGPCKLMMPTVEKLAAEYEGKVVVAVVDIDENPDTPAMLGVRGIPTFIVFNHGKEWGRQVGATTEQKIRSLFAGIVAP